MFDVAGSLELWKEVQADMKKDYEAGNSYEVSAGLTTLSNMLGRMLFDQVPTPEVWKFYDAFEAFYTSIVTKDGTEPDPGAETGPLQLGEFAFMLRLLSIRVQWPD